jgi:NADP-dependent 3-hydroxy acid dehydrogenase YdfG
MTQLSNRVAVITGASSGIGRATAKLLAAGGAKVAVLARRGDLLEQLVAEITAAGGTAMALTVDVTDQAALDAAAATVEQSWGPADLVFNNAGVMLPASIEARDTGPWEQQIDLNVTGAMRVISAFVPQLVKSAEAGATVDLINTSSIAAQNIYPYFAVYSASKAYVSHLTRHLRAELGPKGVRVSVIEPGCTETELQGHFKFPGAIAWLEGARQTITFLKPEDVAAVVGFLATQPQHVNLQQVVVMPTNQTS